MNGLLKSNIIDIRTKLNENISIHDLSDDEQQLVLREIINQISWRASKNRFFQEKSSEIYRDQANLWWDDAIEFWENNGSPLPNIVGFEKIESGKPYVSDQNALNELIRNYLTVDVTESYENEIIDNLWKDDEPIIESVPKYDFSINQEVIIQTTKNFILGKITETLDDSIICENNWHDLYRIPFSEIDNVLRQDQYLISLKSDKPITDYKYSPVASLTESANSPISEYSVGQTIIVNCSNLNNLEWNFSGSLKEESKSHIIISDDYGFDPDYQIPKTYIKETIKSGDSVFLTLFEGSYDPEDLQIQPTILHEEVTIPEVGLDLNSSLVITGPDGSFTVKCTGQDQYHTFLEINEEWNFTVPTKLIESMQNNHLIINDNLEHFIHKSNTRPDFMIREELRHLRY